MAFFFILCVAFSFRNVVAEAPFAEPYIEIHPLTEWIEKLALCESGKRERVINPNDGGSRSVGYVQFKDSTFSAYSKKYGLLYKPEDIFDKEKQSTLAILMLENEKNAWRHWTNCSRKIGLDRFMESYVR